MREAVEVDPMIHTREWGAGPPVLALHPLGLDSRAFEAIAQELARSGLRTIAMDLPGFGETPTTAERLTPSVLAQPVIAFAKQLEVPPVVMGISMGGRVALEAALQAPESFRAVVAIAPYMPWLRYRSLLQFAHLMSPSLAARIPLERIWPLLKRMADSVDEVEYLRNDPVARSGSRLVYHFSCPATRWSFISAARELALDPAHGSGGLWERLPHLSIPAAFIWGAKDRLVSAQLSEAVSAVLPSAEQRILRCVAHAFNGIHHRCLARAVEQIVTRDLAVEPLDQRRRVVIEVDCEIEAHAEPQREGSAPV
jgi:pimeloyl-ACP methyl ester carboxylesterase